MGEARPSPDPTRSTLTSRKKEKQKIKKNQKSKIKKIKKIKILLKVIHVSADQATSISRRPVGKIHPKLIEND